MLIDAPGVEELEKAGDNSMVLTDDNAGEVMKLLQNLE